MIRVPRLKRTARTTCLILTLLGSASAYSSDFVGCPESPVHVSTLDSRTLPAICESAGAALRFLAECGLTSSQPLSIQMVDLLSNPSPDAALASFEAETGRIEILSFEKGGLLLRDGKMFRIPADRSLYLSLVAHEVAHSIVHRQTTEKPLSRATHEYIAYVTQLATLPDAVRQSVLSRFRQQAFTHRQEITDLLWAMDPEVFAVKSYRHFIDPENGCSFLATLLSATP